MKKLAVGVQSAVWYKEDNPAESICYIKECGFETIDFGIADMFFRTFNKETCTSFFDKSVEELLAYYKPLKEACEENDVSIAVAHGLFPIAYPGEDAVNDYLIEVTEKMMAVNAYLGCKAIVIHPLNQPNIRKAAEIEYNMNIYRRLMPAAKKYGVTVCLENIFKHYGYDCYEGACADANEVCRYIDTLNEEAGEKLFGLCLDIGHVKVEGRNLYQFITTVGERIVVLHIHDNEGNSDSHMIPYTQVDRTGGRLAIDWESFIRGMREIGYEGALTFETAHGMDVFPRELQASVLRLISDIGKYFRNRIIG